MVDAACGCGTTRAEEEIEMISMDKKYRTRDGRDVRLLCVDGPGDQPVFGLVNGSVETWSENGAYFGGDPSPSDLIEYHEPDIRTIWVNVYEDVVLNYKTAESARRKATPTAIVIAQPVTFEVKRK